MALSSLTSFSSSLHRAESVIMFINVILYMLVVKMESLYEQAQKLLKEFPFKGRKNRYQEKLLSQYLVVAPGHNKSETAERLGVTRQTVQKIEEEWRGLSDQQRLTLIEYLGREYRNHFQVDDAEVTA